MKREFKYDKQGLGAAELMFLAVYHPVVFVFVAFLIKHNINVLKIVRKFI